MQHTSPHFSVRPYKRRRQTLFQLGIPLSRPGPPRNALDPSGEGKGMRKLYDATVRPNRSGRAKGHTVRRPVAVFPHSVTLPKRKVPRVTLQNGNVTERCVLSAPFPRSGPLGPCRKLNLRLNMYFHCLFQKRRGTYLPIKLIKSIY